jgi:hypothetical protein
MEDQVSDERWIEHQIAEFASEQQYFEFFAGVRGLVRSEHLAAEDRLVAVSHAIDKAVDGNVADATDWTERVTLGLIKL